MSLSLRYAAASDVGLRREGNEDSGYAGPRLLAVADGMGGAAAGEVASSVAIAGLSHLDDDAPGGDLLTVLQDCVAAIGGDLHEIVESNPALEGMGTTLTALLWAGGRVGVVHVGDSRGYLFRDGQLYRITHDHTFVQSLVDEGRLTTDEASTHPQRSVLTRVLDGRHEPDLDLSVREALHGDRYLLCSDGLSGVVSEETIAETLRDGGPDEAVKRLVELVMRGGAPDNVTAVVADVVEDDHHDATPVVVGAAATRTGDHPAPTAETPAGRAALATRPTPRPRAAAPAHAAPSRRRWWKVAVIVSLVVLLLGGALVGGWAYLQAQFYVGSEAGKVTVYRGVAGSVAGVSLHSVDRRTAIPIVLLPAFERERVADGITAANDAGVTKILDHLRDEACTALQPVPKKTTTSKPGTTQSKPRQSPSPAPNPTPSVAPDGTTVDDLGCTTTTGTTSP